MKKVAFLTDQPFWAQPLGSGTLLRNRYRLLSELSNVEVVYLTASDTTKCPLPGATIRLATINNQIISQIKNFINSRNYGCIYSSYDLFWPILKSVSVRKVVEIHDVLHLRAQAFAKYGYDAPIKKTKSEELSSLRNYDAVICLNSDEVNYLRKNYVENVFYIPPNFKEILISNQPDVPAAGIIGSLARPNLDGMDFYRDQLTNGLNLIVAGGLSQVVTGGEWKGTKNLGLVNNLRDFYDKINVALIPVRFGGGIKIKAIEGLMHGKPIFSTLHGIEGLPPGKEEISISSNSKEDWNEENIMKAMHIDRNAVIDYANSNFTDDVCRPMFKNILS